MIINFLNVGPVKNGNIELGDLTVIVGGNNTGKTYITYTIFGLLHYLKNNLGLSEIARNIAIDLRRNDKSSIFLSSEELKSLVGAHVDAFENYDFARIFSTDEDRFLNAKIRLLFSDNELLPTPEKKLTQTLKIRGIEITLNIMPSTKKLGWIIDASINKDVNNSSDKPLGTSLNRILQRIIDGYFYSLFFQRPYLSTSERLGIALFYKDLDSNRNALVEHLQQMNKSKNADGKNFDPFEFLEKATSRFAFPVHENINRIRQLDLMQKENSPIVDLDLSTYISGMMGGSYKVVDDEIIFSNNKRAANRVTFPIHLGSSSLRSLADVFFYLKHSAKQNDLLMIDEPESHLTPQNQIIFVRLIAAAISKGIKVYLTTHSDYIIKEINNLIMLSKVSKTDFIELSNKYGYSEVEVLNSKSVKGYLCSKGTITSCPESDFGLEFSNIDNAIDDLNQRTQDISESLHNSLN